MLASLTYVDIVEMSESMTNTKYPLMLVVLSVIVRKIRVRLA